MESRNTYGYMDEDRMNIPSSSGLVRPKEALTQASVAGEEELTELLVTRSQNERSIRKTAIDEDEDEAATWLHSLPLDYCSDLYSDIVYPQQPYATAAVLATSSKVVSDAPIAEFNNPMQPSGERPPIPSSWRQKLEVSRHRSGRIWKEAGTSGLNEPVKEFNVFESSKTHAAAVATKYRAPSGGIHRRVRRTSTVLANDLTGSGPNVSAADSDPVLLRASMMAMDLKRKERQIEDSDNSEVIAALESLDLQNKASSKSSSSSKKYRCAEVHSLSEKKRRERINERMKVLQELIPRSNKLDKASLLDEAIEYLKSLQLQVQIMSMGYSIAPIMFPGIQQLYTPMTTTTPQVVPGLNLLNPAQLGPSFPLPEAAFQVPPRMNTTTMSVDSQQQHYGIASTPDQDQQTNTNSGKEF